MQSACCVAARCATSLVLFCAPVTWCPQSQPPKLGPPQQPPAMGTCDLHDSFSVNQPPPAWRERAFRPPPLRGSVAAAPSFALDFVAEVLQSSQPRAPLTTQPQQRARQATFTQRGRNSEPSGTGRQHPGGRQEMCENQPQLIDAGIYGKDLGASSGDPTNSHKQLPLQRPPQHLQQLQLCDCKAPEMPPPPLRQAAQAGAQRQRRRPAVPAAVRMLRNAAAYQAQLDAATAYRTG